MLWGKYGSYSEGNLQKNGLALSQGTFVELFTFIQQTYIEFWAWSMHERNLESSEEI